MKRIFCLLITAFLSLWMVSCSHTEALIVKSWESGKPSGDLYISAEIVSETKIPVDSEFEVRIGIGRFGDQYSTAKIEITSSDLTIFSSDGTSNEDSYQIRYNDFDDSKYGLILNDNTEVKYFENFKFKYSGEGQSAQGYIGFKIVVIDSDGEELAGDSVGLYYEVKNGKISISTSRPTDYVPENNLT